MWRYYTQFIRSTSFIIVVRGSLEIVVLFQNELTRSLNFFIKERADQKGGWEDVRSM